MKIICAPDSFKESMTAEAAARAMGRGIRRALPDAEVELCPIADGGDGTVDAMLAAMHGEARQTTVTGPRGGKVDARWGLFGDGAAVIEMAAASGMAILQADQRDPTLTTTFGTGELIAAALDAGARRILIGIGGSATTDGGAGCAQALGVRFIDDKGNEITEPMTGGLLSRIAGVDMTGRDPRIADAVITVACDVTNPMTGPQGAAHIYGPQKGATPRQVEDLDAALRHLADLMRDQLGRDVETIPGSGAAGALGAGLLAFCDATLDSGAKLVLEACKFHERVAGCDLCLTGEGRLDGQSLSGKACLTVAQAAKAAGVPTIALVGCLGEQVERTLEAGLHAYHAISEGLPTDEAIRRGEELLENKTAQILRQSPGSPEPGALSAL